MKRYSVIIISIILSFTFWIVHGLVSNPHSFSEDECTNCHAKEPSKNDKKNSAIMTGSISILCGECHSGIAETYSHPINIVPENTMIPKDLPLSFRGVLTCSTCHDVHSSPTTPMGTPSLFLRRFASGRSFCIICHVEQRLSHKTTVTEAHMQSRFIEIDPSGTIDPMSANCISCHDGSYAISVTIQAGLWLHNKDFIRFDKGSHPIGVDHEMARTRGKRKTDLKPIGMVDPRLKFFGGKIGCGTCHDPYSPERAQLVMSNQGSRLCLECHMVDQ